MTSVLTQSSQSIAYLKIENRKLQEKKVSLPFHFINPFPYASTKIDKFLSARPVVVRKELLADLKIELRESKSKIVLLVKSLVLKVLLFVV